ncbi:unnamed protein product [Pseudo-nitzschia multistriata]|uniref:Phytanoyl-CoA dioxygenase n=1 Tax=Pseudo-nitzschia multistriata TaxID=183589 RepID=A0A448YVF4_9STRA|nr:unnamed protein product [Pseudo-nitzschia multistriata]
MTPPQCSTNDDGGGFRLRIPLLDDDSYHDDSGNRVLSQKTIDKFRSDGFAVFPNVLSPDAVDALNDRLEDVLRGVYDRGQKPDKTPRLLKSHKPQSLPRDESTYPSNVETENPEIAAAAEIEPKGSGKKKKHRKKKGSPSVGPIGFSGNLENVKVLQIINIHKADSLFRRLETSASLAKIVAELAGWEEGARLAQDQVWAKPPGAPPLVFHRDSPYFMFDPPDVVTVWLALDDMDGALGPLEYVKGSHLWGDGRVGSAKQFFQADTRSLLRSAAEREGIPEADLEFVSMEGLERGGLSVHHGRIWHGSAGNSSTSLPRRGLGLHFVPSTVRFTADTAKSKLWKSYVEDLEGDPSEVELPEEDFPLSTAL